MNFIIQLIGFLGFAMSIAAFQFKKHGQIVLCKMSSVLLFSLHYVLLGAWSAAALEFISAIRNLIFYKQVKKNISTTPAIIGFGIFVLATGLATYTGPLSLLPIVCKLLTTVSYGMKNEKWLRIITLPSCIMWVIFNFYVGSIAGMLTDSMSLISIIIAMVKFDLKKSEDQQSVQG